MTTMPSIHDTDVAGQVAERTAQLVAEIATSRTGLLNGNGVELIRGVDLVEARGRQG
jgi:hypothetical protein